MGNKYLLSELCFLFLKVMYVITQIVYVITQTLDFWSELCYTILER